VGKESVLRETVLGIIFLLFMLCFIAIIIEETFLGGRKKRKLLREARAKQQSASN
jgi:hypothetical protein